MRTRPFGVRGVVEGFYGPFYTAPEREDLIRFLGREGYNAYFYGPKNDRQHRARWREPYPEKVMRRFAETVRVADEAGIAFAYAISPGESICYSSEADFALLTGKLRAFYDIGVRAFSLWLDDIHLAFACGADADRYVSYAAAHTDLCNRVHAWLQALDPGCWLSMCPTDYWGTSPFSDYIRELGAALHPEIDIFYTGPQICSPDISARDVALFAEIARRAPLLWDNYPVNDLAMQSELHVGPVRGRDPMLYLVAKGAVANPMIQAEASKIPLLTYARYLSAPTAYDPDAAFVDAVAQIAGEDSADAMRTFAENSLHSVLADVDAPRLQSLVEALLSSLHSGEALAGNPRVAALEDYLTEMDEASYQLKFRMDNLALRNNLLPWIELLDLWLWMARRALVVLRALERGEDYQKPHKQMAEWLDQIRHHHKRIAGKVLMPLADYVREQVRKRGESFAEEVLA